MNRRRLFLFTLIAALAVSLPAAAESFTAVASNITGVVQKSSGGGWSQIRNHEKLRSGDTVKTGADGSVILTFDSGNALSLSKLTTVTLADISRSGNAKKSIIKVDGGRMLAVARPLKNSDSVFEVRTAQGSAGVRGSEVAVTVEENKTLFQIVEGRFNVTVGGVSAILEAGFQMDVAAGLTKPPEPAQIDPAALQSLKKELGDTKTAGFSADALSAAEDATLMELNDVFENLQRANEGSCYTYCSYWSNGVCAYVYEHCHDY